MARSMAATRKGAKPHLVVAIGIGKKAPGADDGTGDDTQDDAPDATDAGKGASDGDVAKCPNCGCEFDDETDEVVKPGKPVQGGPEHYQGTDLDAGDDAPAPLNPRAAAYGSGITGNLIDALRSRMK